MKKNQIYKYLEEIEKNIKYLIKKIKLEHGLEPDSRMVLESYV